MRRSVRSLEQEVRPEEPCPLVTPAREQQQARGHDMSREQGRQKGGKIAVLAKISGQTPREQEQRRSHLDSRDADHDGEEAANECAGVRGLVRRPESDLPITGIATASEDLRQHTQVAQRAALGGCRESRAPVPLDTLVQRDGVGYVGDEICTIVLGHPQSRRPRQRPGGVHAHRVRSTPGKADARARTATNNND